MAGIRLLEIGKSTAGIGTYLRQLAHGLDHEKFQVTFICLSEGAEDLAKELNEMEGVRAFAWPMNRFQIDLFGDMLIALRLIGLVRKNGFDLIHAHGSKAGFLARLASVGSGVPVVYSPHCFSFHAGAGRMQAWLFSTVERIMAAWATEKILTVSDGERELARRYNVGLPEQFVTVHNSAYVGSQESRIDRSKVKRSLQIQHDAPLVGAVGRLNRQKAPLSFVRMAGVVNRELPEAHFVWIGSGPLLDDARQLAMDLGLGGVIHFPGERRDVPDILQALDCFVLPSLWEGLSIVLLEAMAAGAPVVASDIPGNREVVIHGENGWLVGAEDYSSFAGCVLDILQNPARSAAVAAAGRRRVSEEFTLDRMLRGVEGVYLSIAGANGRNP